MVYRSTSGSPAEVLMGALQPGSVSVPVEGALLSARLRDVASGDDFEVKDFGYGFGPASGTGRALVITREEREERERGYMREREMARIEKERERMERERVERVERERTEREKIERELQREIIKRELQRGRERERTERELQREPAVVKDYGYERDQEETVRDIRDMDVPVHPMRGSFNGGVGYDRGERGVRRGRGMNGFGRGYPNRRGSGFQQHIVQQQPPPPPPPPQQQQQPFTITPPQNVFQPLQTVSDPPKYYPQHLSPYVPPGYENYLPPTTSSTAAPPLPVPVTAISFPLDPTRWYVLGQLEYYLSPQNMAQDLFLRQQVVLPSRSFLTVGTQYDFPAQMDARGWVPVSLIASFNRVRQLTMDVHLVRDVLLLSSMVQVKGDWVRMKGWEQFVFPDATASDVEDDEHPETYDQPFQEMYGDFHARGEHAYGEPSSYSEVHDDMSAAELEQQDRDADGDSEEDNDDDDYEDETDDEEDVVFVMSHDDEGQPWPPERLTSS
jgi:la-related protein 1